MSEVAAEVWAGLLAPSATPMTRIAQPAEWFAAAMKSPEVDAKPERRPLSGGSTATMILMRSLMQVVGLILWRK